MAITSPNLGLKLWTLPSDAYDSGQLADNFARVDEHDHSNGKGVPIGTAGIQDGAITGAKFAPGAIPAPPAQQPVGTAFIIDGAVTAPKLASGAITTAALPTLPYALVKRSTNQSISTSSSGFLVTFTTLAYDTNALWNAGAPTLLTCRTGGLYLLSAQAAYAYSNAYGNGMLAIQVNGTDAVRQSAYTDTSSNASMNIFRNASTAVRLNATDTISVRLWANSTGNISSSSLVVAYLSS